MGVVMHEESMRLAANALSKRSDFIVGSKAEVSCGGSSIDFRTGFRGESETNRPGSLECGEPIRVDHSPNQHK